MCIILHKPQGKKLADDIYRHCFKQNPDGAGVAWAAGGELTVDKGFFDEDEFIKRINELEQHELIIHFRVSTHGKINEANCHPFFFKSKDHPNYSFAMAHNGQLSWRSTNKMSDTHCFAVDFLEPWLNRDPWMLDQPHALNMMEAFINDKNKMVIMRYDKEKNQTKTYILNHKAGETAHGCWFSNTTYYTFRRTVAVVGDEMFERYSVGGGYGFGVGGNIVGGYRAPVVHLPSQTQKTPERAPEIEELFKRHMIEGEYGDWVRMDKKYVNIKSDYAGAGKATQEQVTRYGLFKADLIALRCKLSDAAKNKTVAKSPDDKVTITVPRDPEVLGNSLDLLTQTERKLIRKICVDYLKETDFKFKGKTTEQIVAEVRKQLRDSFAEYKTMSDEDLNLELLTTDFYPAGSEDKTTERASKEMAEAADKAQ